MIRKIFTFFIAIGFGLILVAFATEKSDRGDFEAAKEIIIMRNIAHQILQYTGDSTSPIPPVNQLSATEFQIPFESSFSFVPDSIIRIIDKVISFNHLPENYIVNVLDYNTKKVVYGYAMLPTQQQSILPCIGRNQPSMHYCINIKFKKNALYAAKNLYIAGIGLLGISLLLFQVQRHKRKKHKEIIIENNIDVIENNTIAIGQFIFYTEDQYLNFKNEKIVLTSKESKLLSIFAMKPNQIIDRNRLQKEVWEDEGVIVGRSLDMFISKLRKKLELDPNVKLINIHSKGYKLEIDQHSI